MLEPNDKLNISKDLQNTAPCADWTNENFKGLNSLVPKASVDWMIKQHESSSPGLLGYGDEMGSILKWAISRYQADKDKPLRYSDLWAAHTGVRGMTSLVKDSAIAGTLHTLQYRGFIVLEDVEPRDVGPNFVAMSEVRWAGNLEMQDSILRIVKRLEESIEGDSDSEEVAANQESQESGEHEVKIKLHSNFTDKKILPTRELFIAFTEFPEFKNCVLSAKCQWIDPSLADR